MIYNQYVEPEILMMITTQKRGWDIIPNKIASK